MQGQLGATVNILISTMMGQSQTALVVFSSEKPLFLREYATNHYSVIPYFLSYLFTEAIQSFCAVFVQVRVVVAAAIFVHILIRARVACEPCQCMNQSILTECLGVLVRRHSQRMVYVIPGNGSILDDRLPDALSSVPCHHIRTVHDEHGRIGPIGSSCHEHEVGVSSVHPCGGPAVLLFWCVYCHKPHPIVGPVSIRISPREDND